MPTHFQCQCMAPVKGRFTLKKAQAYHVLDISTLISLNLLFSINLVSVGDFFKPWITLAGIVEVFGDLVDNVNQHDALPNGMQSTST